MKWAAILALVLLVPAAAACSSPTPISSRSEGHTRSTSTTTPRTTTTKPKTNASATTADALLDAQACSTLDQAMQASASGRVGYNDAVTFVNAANAAGDNGVGTSRAALFAHDAGTFESLFTTNSPGNPGSVNFYPTAAVGSDCQVVGVTLPLPSPSPTTTTTTPLMNDTTGAVVASVTIAENEPASYVTATLDPNDPTWSKWNINDPNIGSAYGFSELIDGTWQLEAGPGSAEVGCPGGGPQVPSLIISDLGAACPAS